MRRMMRALIHDKKSVCCYHMISLYCMLLPHDCIILYADTIWFHYIVRWYNMISLYFIESEDTLQSTVTKVIKLSEDGNNWINWQTIDFRKHKNLTESKFNENFIKSTVLYWALLNFNFKNYKETHLYLDYCSSKIVSNHTNSELHLSLQDFLA